MLEEDCDDDNEMQPCTAPIMSDALDIMPLYSRMVCEKVTTAAAKNVQFSQENQQQEGRSRFLQVLLLAMAAVNDAIAGAGLPPRLDVLLATVAADDVYTRACMCVCQSRLQSRTCIACATEQRHTRCALRPITRPSAGGHVHVNASCTFERT